MSSYNTRYKHPREIIFTPSDDAPAVAAAEMGMDTAVEQDGDSGYLPLVIPGQGTFVFKYKQAAEAGSPAVRSVSPPAEPLQVGLCIPGSDGANPLELVQLLIDGNSTVFPNRGTVAGEVARGFIRSEYAFYWLSLDTTNECIRAGCGEARLETESLCIPIPGKEFADLQKIQLIAPGPSIKPMRLLRDPIVSRVPMVVRNTDEITMENIAAGDVQPKAALSPVGQKLYDIISGKNFVLDSPEFPEFARAIKRSIETPGCWCHEKLREKQTEFGGDNPHQVYLRITLGQNGGESPGIPFVMEIWPPQCYSPVHQHAGANAIIRVLHGDLSVTMYPFLAQTASPEGGTPRSTDVAPFAIKSFRKGDITWISPTQNQVHRLKNNAQPGDEPCITIQCYMYDEDDRGHYPFFDYVDDEGGIHQYTPDSDMDFLTFRQTVRREYLLS